MLSRYALIFHQLETILYCPLLYVVLKGFGGTGSMGIRRVRRLDRLRKEPLRLPLFEDRGTPQLRRHRGQLLGDPDSRLAAFPLGVLRAHHLISWDEYHAGCRYIWLF